MFHIYTYDTRLMIHALMHLFSAFQFEEIEPERIFNRLCTLVCNFQVGFVDSQLAQLSVPVYWD